jgi:hypothetical protein
MIGEEILAEIDKTLDQLICNAEIIQKVEVKALHETEIDAFQKTQESLLHHLLHMDQKLAEKRAARTHSRIQAKRQKFATMQTAYSKTLEEAKPRLSIHLKRRSKRLLAY